MRHSLLIHNAIWDDIKKLQNKFNTEELFPALDFNDEIDEVTKLRLIPQFKAITDYISNIFWDKHYSVFDHFVHQPFLDEGWEIYKVRYAIARLSKRDGLRIIVLEHQVSSKILLLLVKLKAECDNEKKFQKEVLKRANGYFTY